MSKQNTLGNLTPAQSRIYRQLMQGYVIQHLTGRTYGLVDPKHQHRRKRVNAGVFSKLLDEGLLKVVDSRESFEIYAAADSESLAVCEDKKSFWVSKGAYRPTPLFAVSPTAWRSWNQ